MDEQSREGAHHPPPPHHAPPTKPPKPSPRPSPTPKPPTPSGTHTGGWLYVDSKGVIRDKDGAASPIHGFNITNITGSLCSNQNKGLKATDVADLAKAAGNRADRFVSSLSNIAGAKPTRSSDGHLVHPGLTSAKLNQLGTNIHLYKDRGIRVYLDIAHKTVSGAYNNGSAGIPAWMFPGMSDAQAVTFFYTNQPIPGLGNIPNDPVKYGNRAGKPWGCLDVVTDLECQVAEFCLQQGLDNMCGVDLHNEPQPHGTTEIGGYRAFVENASQRLWAVNPDLLVIYETNLLPRSMNPKKGDEFYPDVASLPHFRPPIAGRGGLVFSGHSYWYNFTGSTPTTRAFSDSHSQVLDRWCKLAQSAGHAFHNGENGYMEQTRNDKANLIWNGSSPVSAEDVWFHNFIGSSNDGGLVAWAKKNNASISGWAFMPGQGGSHVHTDGSKSDVGTGTWHNQIKTDSNCIARPSPDRMYRALLA